MSLTDQLNDLNNKLIETKDLKNYRRVIAENLNVEIATLFDKSLAYEIQKGLDDVVEYYDENSLKVKVFGKWHPIPRKMVRSIFLIFLFCSGQSNVQNYLHTKIIRLLFTVLLLALRLLHFLQTQYVSIQAAYSDEGITYSFSGLTMPTKNWIPLLSQLQDIVSKLTGFNYNFVLVNRLEQKFVSKNFFFLIP